MPIRLSALVFASSSSEVAHRLQGPQAERSTNPDFQTIRFRASSSHARDVSSDVYFLSVPPGDAHESGERGPSDYDIRNTFAGAVSYDIPSPRDGIAKPILGGWSTDSIVYARSAPPVNVVTGQDPFNTGFLSGACGVTRPNLIQGGPLYLDESNVPIVIYFTGFECEMPVGASNLKAVQFAAQCSINKEGGNSWIMLLT
jgi:hypothetical protein